MRFAIFSHVEHSLKDLRYYGYGPYIKEMNIWLKYVDQVEIVAPLTNQEPNIIDLYYKNDTILFSKIPSFDLTNGMAVLKSFFVIPLILLKIFQAMYMADHIHLRCPGNVGLLACFVQILFPWKKKTAKYAGNWDPKAIQPWSYRLQKRILSNTFLTKNMQVLVYGEWPDQTKNVKPFFTASYSEKDKLNLEFRIDNLELLNPIKFLFVGTLSLGKQPLYAIQLVEQLLMLGNDVRLDIYGDGILKKDLVAYIHEKGLNEYVNLHGNQEESIIKQAYQLSQFIILPSKSEGWPKVVAEAMFWGCIPIVSSVSCVPYMLDNGSRGILLGNNLEENCNSILSLIDNKQEMDTMTQNAQLWSQKYTLEYFEEKIVSLL